MSAQVSQQDEGCRGEESGFRGVIGDTRFHEELKPVVMAFGERRGWKVALSSGEGNRSLSVLGTTAG